MKKLSLQNLKNNNKSNALKLLSLIDTKHFLGGEETKEEEERNINMVVSGFDDGHM